MAFNACLGLRHGRALSTTRTDSTTHTKHSTVHTQSTTEHITNQTSTVTHAILIAIIAGYVIVRKPRAHALSRSKTHKLWHTPSSTYIRARTKQAGNITEPTRHTKACGSMRQHHTQAHKHAREHMAMRAHESTQYQCAMHGYCGLEYPPWEAASHTGIAHTRQHSTAQCTWRHAAHPHPRGR